MRKATSCFVLIRASAAVSIAGSLAMNGTPSARSFVSHRSFLSIASADPPSPAPSSSEINQPQIVV